MRLFRGVPKIDFMKGRFLFGCISLVAVLLSLVLVATKGLRYGIDFAGGIEIQVKFTRDVTTAEVRAALVQGGIGDASVVAMEGEVSEYLVSLLGMHEHAEQLANQTRNSLITKFGAETVEIRKVDMVGPKVGADLKKSGLFSIVYTLLAVLIYIWFRFDLKFAPGAVVCLIHDAVVTIGIYCLLDKEFNLTILAAILTILGYSLNDTIVIFDRVRENLGKGAMKLRETVNASVNETLSRTILTSLTTLFTVTALLTLGGGVIHDFAFALMVGILVGTYSTVFVASPLVLVMDNLLSKQTPARRTAKA